MKKITFLLILMTSILSYTQNIKIIEESLSKENSLKIDKITLEHEMSKGDLVYLKARFRIDNTGKVEKIVIHKKSKLFDKVLTEMINKIPLLQPSEYNTLEIFYDLHGTIELDSKRKRSNRINNSKKELITFNKLFVTIYLPYETIEVNKSETFQLKELDNLPVLNECRKVDKNNRELSYKCLKNNLLINLNKKTNTRLSESKQIETFVLSFIISKTGKIINITALSEDELIKEEVVRAASTLPHFLSPGKISGKPVFSKVRMPVTLQSKND